MGGRQPQELVPSRWVIENGFVNETQQPLEYKDHRFLIKPLNDSSPDIVVKKSAQVGFSVLAILKSIWLARYMGMNVGYVLPSQNIVKDFVAPKVDPVIYSNPVISKLVGIDSVTLKQIGERFIYFRGAFSEREAIAISLDALILDELDRMPNMSVVNTYDSRLQASKHGWRARFSNPSGIGYGVDHYFQDSDQMHWFIKCHWCNHEWYLDFEPSGKCHFVHKELQEFICGACGKVLSDNDRRNGRWVPRFEGRNRRGYWISQMMAPWVSAKRIIEQYEESNTQFFHNFVLGKAFTPSDLVVNRETILRACAPSTIPKLNVVIGVDQNVNEQIWVAGTPQGIFAHGKTKSWEDLERLKLMWNAVVVCDPNPYPTYPKILADKYNDFYLIRFKEFHNLQNLDWKGQDVWADRTKVFDVVANEITEARLLFREKPYDLEDYIADWQNIYRTTVEKLDGRSKSEWLKKDNRESDYSLATVHFRIGLTRILQSGSVEFIEPNTSNISTITDTINEDGRLQTSLGQNIKDTLDSLDD